MADWNPNEPRLLGQEWMPTYAAGQPLTAAQQIGAAWFDSTSAETIETLGAYFSDVTEEGQWLMEVYEAASAVIGAESTDVFRPNTDVARVNAENQAGGTANLYQSIDETTVSYADYVTSTPGASASYDHELDTAAWAAGRRVKDVRVTFVGRQIAGSHLWQLLVADSGEGFFTYWSQTVSAETGLVTVTVSLGESNPFTGLPWWQGDITDFDSAAKYLRWRFVSPSGEDAEARLYQVYVSVIYATENRECVAAHTPTAGGEYWSEVALVTPAGATTWSKANATEYVVTMRRFRKTGAGTAGGTDVPPPAETGRASWGFLAGADYVPSRASYAPTLDVRGGIESLGTAGTRGYAFGMVSNVSVCSTDSQPYNTLVTFAATALAQLVVPTVNQDPTRVRFMVHSSSTLSGTLTITVEDAVPPPSISGSITAAEVEALPFVDAAEQWRVVEVELTAGLATLVAATTYTITLTASAGDWQIGAAAYTRSGTALTDADNGAYEPYQIIDGSGLAQAGTIMVQTVEPPTPPADVVAAAVAQAVPSNGTDCEDTIPNIDGAQVTWTATALGADFARYEIGRDEGDGTVVFLHQLDETNELVYDFTALRGIAVDYYLRVVDVLGIASDWVAAGDVTALMMGCELIFTSNERPDLNMVGLDGPVREWEFLSGPDVVFMPVEDRDYQLAIKGTEWRGDRFRRILTLWGSSTGAAPGTGSGRVVFDPLNELTRAALAYVAVLDSDGRRWLAEVQAMSGTRRMRGQLHQADVVVTEITADPIVEVTGAQPT